MILSCAPDAFDALFTHPHPFYAVPDTFPVRFIPGDRIELTRDGDMMQRFVAEVIDVRLNAKAHQWILTLHPIADIPAYIATPAGLLMVHADDHDPHAGYSIWIDDTEAAAVEWHPDSHCLVLRTYNDHNATPQYYHQWNGVPMPADLLHSDPGGASHDQ